jgi:hypothetical protein
MMAAQIGVVFHTTYSGKTMEDMRATFNVDLGGLKTTKNVWYRDASFTDASGTATFTEAETKQISRILSQAGTLFQSIPGLTLNRISASDVLLTYIKTFNNAKVREGKKITDTRIHTIELIKYVESQLNKKIQEVKRQDSKKKYIAEKTEVMRFFRAAAPALKSTQACQ